MALVKFGGGVAAMSGKIEGTVFARNRAGAYARNWAKPVSAPTESQSERRVLFGGTASDWSGLANAERDSWNALAKTTERTNRIGEQYQPNGRQIFMEVQQNMKLSSLTPFTFAPASADKPALPVDFTVSLAEDAALLETFTFTFASTPDTDLRFILFATPPTPSNAARSNWNTVYRRIGDSFNITANAFSPLAAYISLYGDNVQPDSVINWKLSAIAVSTGQVTDQLIGQTLITVA